MKVPGCKFMCKVCSDGRIYSGGWGVEEVIPIHRSDGICHQLMTEAGYVKPGDIAFGTDSHTTTYGCVGAFSSGIGYTEMASILGTGTMWIKVRSLSTASP